MTYTVLKPGQSVTIPIDSLVSRATAGTRYSRLYWTEPGEYTLSAFLVGDAWKTSGVWVYTFWDGHPHETLALGALSFIVTWGASLVILGLFGRRSASEVGRA